jgi:1-phosphatidylinositol-3-phosphate 5-kinase
MGDNLEALRKSLPRLPSVDDAYEVDDDMSTTPKPVVSILPPLPPNSALPGFGPHKQLFHDVGEALGKPPTGSPKNISPSVTPRTPRPPSLQGVDPAKLLSTMRHSFQRTEQSLYSQLSRASESSLNDVRRSFLSAAKGASRRLGAWQDKHLPSKARSEFRVEKLSAREPEWWKKSCHVVPGGNIIVREDDWGSIIAFTLR